MAENEGDVRPVVPISGPDRVKALTQTQETEVDSLTGKPRSRAAYLAHDTGQQAANELDVLICPNCHRTDQLFPVHACWRCGHCNHR